MHILLVDNHKNDLVVNRDFLMAYGHKVDGVSSAAEAMEVAKVTQYDLVLLEINLPDDSGLSLIKTFSEVEPSPPVYVLTEGVSVARAIKAIKLNAIDVIFKPLDDNKLAQIQNADVQPVRKLEKKKRKPPKTVPSTQGE